MKNVLEIFNKLEKTSSRLEAVDALEEHFSKMETKSVIILVYLIEGLLAPDFISPKFSFSKESLLKLLKEYILNSNLDIEEPASLVKKFGGVGDVFEFVWRKNSKEKSLITISELYDKLWQLSSIVGKDSVNKKLQYTTKLLTKLSPEDAKFVSRILLGKLRIGFSKKTVLDVFVKHLLNLSENLDKKEIRKLMDYAYGVSSDLGFIAGIVYDGNLRVEDKVATLRNLNPVVGVPIFPQLVQRVGSFEEVFKRYPNGLLGQPKYDGLRFQLHVGVDYASDIFKQRIWSSYINNVEKKLTMFSTDRSLKVKAFSRNLQDIGDSFPEILNDEAISSLDGCILDGEVVAMKDGEFIPFQHVMQRKRKYNVSEYSGTLPVYYFVFDILVVNGKSVMHEPLDKRIRILRDILKNNVGHIKVTTTEFVQGMSDLEDIFSDSVDKGFEGIVLKKKDSLYLPGVRNYDWIKLKKSINNKVVDTVDAVVMGYYKATGDKVNTKLGAMLVGLFNKETEMFESLTKVGTGMSDKQRLKIAIELDQISSDKKPVEYVVDKNLYPDVWVVPQIVITIDADEITKSAIHMVGKKELGFGLSLRFPRLVEFGRDKEPEDSTSTQELIQMYRFEKENTS